MTNKKSTPLRPRSGGQILADQLAILGAEFVYCVPGESFLDLLDGLHNHQDQIRTITCRHESGASNMAEAYGKLTGKPGICAVTRGPGATNASNGVHTAFQDSTPMIVLIGQVGRDMIDRDAFQEMDYRRMFGQMAKWVAQIDDAARIPEYISRAWHLAQSGRPGPVVLALPEDMLTDVVSAADLQPAALAQSGPTSAALEDLSKMLAEAQKPMLVVGGAGWDAECAALAARFAETFNLPVATAFRRQDYIDNDHPNFAGVIGIAPPPSLRKALKEEVDLLIALGPRLGEMTTQGYDLIDIPTPQMRFVHIHAGSDELGHVYAPDLAIASPPKAVLQAALDQISPEVKTRAADWGTSLHSDLTAFRKPVEVPGAVNMSDVIAHMSSHLPQDTIYTNGAGNYAVWLHRFHSHRSYRTQLAPTSGSMGYGVPAAVAAKLLHPEREVICLAGDGCFMMTSQELATAHQFGAPVIFVIVNNGMYGTIRMHQERTYPARVMSTVLENPDFVAYAKAFGLGGEKVEKSADFPAALERARAAKTGYLIELVVDPEALTPAQTLSEARVQGEKSKS
jgi:acetolactate synthase-1/2/3 large subunit